MKGDNIIMAIEKETRFKNSYLDKKISESITALLNEMIPTKENPSDEDVSLPELFNRLTDRIKTLEIKLSGHENTTTYEDVQYYDSFSEFPIKGKEDILYIDKEEFRIYIYDTYIHEYLPFMCDSVTTKVTTEDIQQVVAVINGGSANM